MYWILIDNILRNENKNSYFNGILFSDLSTDKLPVFLIVKNEIALTNNNDKYYFKRRINPDSIKLFQNELNKFLG